MRHHVCVPAILQARQHCAHPQICRLRAFTMPAKLQPSIICTPARLLAKCTCEFARAALYWSANLQANTLCMPSMLQATPLSSDYNFVSTARLLAPIQAKRIFHACKFADKEHVAILQEAHYDHLTNANVLGRNFTAKHISCQQICLQSTFGCLPKVNFAQLQ